MQRATPDALPVELAPDLVGPVDGEVLPVDPGDLGPSAPRPGRERSTVAASSPSSRWSGRSAAAGAPADRLDPEAVPVGVDVGDYLLRRRSSSAPKKVAADLRIGGFNRSAQRFL